MSYGLALNCYFLPELKSVVKEVVCVDEIYTRDLLLHILQSTHSLPQKIIDKRKIFTKIKEDYHKWSNGKTDHFKENLFAYEYLKNILLHAYEETNNANVMEMLEELQNIGMFF